ncbi:hypothetical protein DP73_04455 [Desulfosporosinus sp. HMP52]|uniref:hypothetical protein n=1 Tax=Desulfosporosinus sp. HMP52 TaxID=1487923 RepID=UPI00051F9A7E|nr:hypothetical protein [Desulfosporosinus sp. HMP52]KGK91225.1 hypothetical protein DP73_04455 [Desulfosporosinus sp. HMP52]
MLPLFCTCGGIAKTCVKALLGVIATAVIWDQRMNHSFSLWGNCAEYASQTFRLTLPPQTRA